MPQENRLVYSAATGETTTEQFEFIGPTLDEVKATQMAIVNAAFENQCANGTSTGLLTSIGMHVYDSLTDLNNYEIALKAMQARGDASRIIKVKEIDPFVTVTLTQLQAVVSELAVHGDDLWSTKQAKYNQIAACETAEAVRAIAW